ncbi:MAG: TetR/AcrR family transcriptional regulator [Bacteroidia bacterium]
MRTRDENKESAIREKAMKMIVDEGFDGLSMQKLAKAANVSPATIYIYYKNREDLLTQLFNHVQQTFYDVALAGFNPDLSFEEGLWIQWKNRLKFILKYPVHFQFYEQFRNSPCINHTDVQLSAFKQSMKLFAMNAMKKGELKKMDPEIFWSIAYGTFYSMVKFHLQEITVMGNNFKLTEVKMKAAFEMVIKALKP